MLARMWKERESSCTVGESVNWCILHGEQYRVFSKKENDWSAIPLLGILSNKTKTRIQKDICTLMFIAAFLQCWFCILKYIHNGILLSHKKEWNLDICENKDGPWGHYGKWSKSDRVRQIAYYLTYMCNFKNSNNKPSSKI